MTTAMSRDRGTVMAAAPVTPLALLPRRRRWGLTAAGVVLVVVGAIASYLVFVTAGVTRPYLALAHSVPYGTTISADDLTVVNVNPVAGLQTIPASQRAQIVGMHAATDLYAGTLLTRAELTKAAIPAPGQQLVGIELKPAQLPARSLKPGDAVLLVIVPPSGLAGVPDPQATSATTPSTIEATVAGESAPETNGNVRVDVAVSASSGPTVAAMSAAGRIVIVVTTRS